MLSNITLNAEGYKRAKERLSWGRVLETSICVHWTMFCVPDCSLLDVQDIRVFFISSLSVCSPLLQRQLSDEIPSLLYKNELSSLRCSVGGGSPARRSPPGSGGCRGGAKATAGAAGGRASAEVRALAVVMGRVGTRSGHGPRRNANSVEIGVQSLRCSNTGSGGTATSAARSGR